MSRGLGDVYKRQAPKKLAAAIKLLAKYNDINSQALHTVASTQRVDPAPLDTTPTLPHPSIYDEDSLFHTLDQVLDIRYMLNGNAELLCQWKAGFWHAADPPPRCRPLILASRQHPDGGHWLLDWRAHWTPADHPALATQPAAQSFLAAHARNPLPPPPLGRPLPSAAATQHCTVNIDMTEMHPDFDCNGTGHAHIKRTPDADYYYDSRGHIAGYLPHAKTADLWTRYHRQIEHNRRCGTPEPTLLPFEQEVVHLLHRYRNKAKANMHGPRVNLRNHWATPTAIQQALTDCFTLSTELFASPLNVNPASRHYCSAHARDAVFGATHDAYSAAWTGAVQLNPEYESADLLQAVKWAKACALTSTQPFLAVGVLPKWSSQAYQKEIANHPHTCHILATVPRK
jgi:hypothetical protein